MDDLKDRLGIYEMSRDDGALTSAVYYTLTGRKGLSVHQDKDRAVVSCQHPNLEGVELVFPEIGNIDYSLSANVISNFVKRGKKVRLARYTQYDIKRLSEFLHDRLNADKLLNVYQEDILDWGYPVQIISTEKVSRHRGDKFQSLRTDCNNFCHENAKHFVQRLSDCDNPYKMMRYILKTWEAQMIWRDKDGIDYEDYYNYLFQLSLEHPESIDGFILYDGEFPIAVSLWDIPHQDQVIGLSNICNTMYRGLSSYLMTVTCKILHEKGISMINMGGSETKELDAFKRQRFRPVKSLNIYSAHVDYDHDQFVKNTDLNYKRDFIALRSGSSATSN